MDDDVVDKVRLQQHHAPVEAERAVRGAAAPAGALIANEDRRTVAGPQPVPPSGYVDWQTFLSALAIPRDDGLAHPLPAQVDCETLRHSDPKPPVVESHRCLAGVARLHHQDSVASEVGQCFAADKAPRREP